MKFYLKFVLIIFSFSISAQPNDNFNERPKLVVGIVVDQMKYEYIPKFWNKYGSKGFKRLVKDGFNAKNAHYSYAVTSTAVSYTHLTLPTT